MGRSTTIDINNRRRNPIKIMLLQTLLLMVLWQEDTRNHTSSYKSNSNCPRSSINTWMPNKWTSLPLIQHPRWSQWLWMLLNRDNTPCLKTKCSFFLISPRASHSILQRLKTIITRPRIMSDTVKTIIQVNIVTNHRIIFPHNNSTTPLPNTCPSLQPAPSKTISNSTI